LNKGNYERVLTLKEDVLRKMDERFNLRWYVGALLGASWAYTALGRWHEAEEEGQKALEVAQEFSDNSLISFAAGYISILYVDKGDMNLAIECGELAVAKAPTPTDKAISQSFLARTWCRSGQPEKGIAVLSAVVQTLRAARFVPMELVSLQDLGVGYKLAGEYDEARQTAEEVLQRAERCGARAIIGLAHHLLGEVALELNLAEAGTHFKKCAEICQEVKTENGLALAYSGMGRYHKQQGNTEEAREYLTKALQIFERLGTLIEPDNAKKELSELTD
jgi:tetratricopeptide (TPR) repeat protein